MYLAHILTPVGRRRIPTATLVRRRSNHRQHRPRRWVMLTAAGLMCAGAVVALLSGPSWVAPMAGLLNGNNTSFGAGPIDAAD